MKGMRRVLIASVLGAIFTASATLSFAQPPISEKLRKQIQPPVVPQEKLRTPIPPVIKECRDPAAVSLTFQVLSRDRAYPTQGRIRLTGVVKNVGNVAFESDPRQASAQLTEQSPGGRPAIRAQQDIANLAPNATITLTYELAWDTAREFPPTFTLLLSYDPDIYLDANKKNDDCNQNNNKKELTGAAINAGWSR